MLSRPPLLTQVTLNRNSRSLLLSGREKNNLVQITLQPINYPESKCIGHMKSHACRERRYHNPDFLIWHQDAADAAAKITKARDDALARMRLIDDANAAVRIEHL